MGFPHTFAALSTAQMSFLDDNFNAAGALTTVQATSSGTNAFTLTPAANAPAVTAYGLPNPVRFGFVAASTSTGTVTARVNALAFLKVFLPSGVQANTGDINGTSYYEVIYLATLDSGNGGFLIVSALPASGTTPVATGNAKGLVVTNNAGTAATKIDITASKAVLVTSTGAPIFVTSPTATIDLTTTGLNGMDTGARPANGWVYCYLISNGVSVGGIATTTSPTAGSFSPVPSGYIYSLYVGAFFLNGSSNLMGIKQLGRRAQYIVGLSGTTVAPLVFSGTTASTWGSKSIVNFVPLTASVCIGAVSYNNSEVGIAPNGNYGVPTAATNAPPTGTNTATTQGTLEFNLLLESTNLFIWTSATSQLYVNGWDDYYVNA